MGTWKRTRHGALSVVLLAAIAALPAFAADGDKSTIKGPITAVQGDTLTVLDREQRQADGPPDVDHGIQDEEGPGRGPDTTASSGPP